MMLGINGRFMAARLTGVQRFAAGLTTALCDRTLVTFFLPANAPKASFPANVRVIRGKLSGHAWEQLELPRLVRRAGIDVLLNPANTAPRSGGNAIVVHDVLPLTHPHWFARPYVFWQRHVVRPAIVRARHIFAPSVWSALEIARACGIPRRRVRVITQGLAPFFGPASPETTAAVLDRFDITPPYFLFVGLGDPRKNIELLLRALDELQRTRRFTLVAIGRHTSRIHSAQTDTTRPWLRSLQQVSDLELHALYTGARALCFPSLAEGFGRPPLEALACGTPALIGDYGSAHEVFGADATILPYDPAAWLPHLRRLLDDAGERTRLARRGAARLSEFDWNRAADQVIASLEADTMARTPVPAFAAATSRGAG